MSGGTPRGDDEAFPPRRAAPWWPPLLAILAIGAIYLVLPDQYIPGPRWWLLGGCVFLAVPFIHFRRTGRHPISRALALALAGLVTLALIGSVTALILQLTGGLTQAVTLLADAALIWVANVLVFALWYWELDGGGPAERHRKHLCSTDFVFPQMQLEHPSRAGWTPHFIDYVFLAFNTSTAFSPTDTMVLARRAKWLLMLQSLISLVTIAVLAARAINTLGV